MFHRNGPTFFELARQALSSTKAGYDLLAPKFDYTPFRTNDLILSAVSRQLSELSQVQSPRHNLNSSEDDQSQSATWKNGLDVCCGTGAGMKMLLAHCSDSVTGVDFSSGMLEIAKSNVQSESKEVRFSNQDVFEMTWDQPQFDLACCFGALGHILPKYEIPFIKKVYECLSPGGQFVFVTSTMPSMFSPTYWCARGFNGAMHVRNFFIRPPFIMFYLLTFVWPEIESKLKSVGFSVQCFPTFPDRRALKLVKTVVATKPLD